MGKKILGGLFLGASVLLVVGGIANGTLFSDKGSDAANLGGFIGGVLPIILYVLSGVLLLTFDSVCKLSYLDGFKRRGLQSVIILLFTVLYGALSVIVYLGALEAAQLYAYATSENISILLILLPVIPMVIPCLIFAVLIDHYAIPHWASKKHFGKQAGMLQAYLSDGESFRSYSRDDFVLASEKALFFPKLFCVIPMDAIASVNLKKPFGVHYVYFYLKNGKKFYLITKRYDEILAALNAHPQQHSV